MMRPGARGDRGGFALVMVVFLLFAVAVAGATGYQVVSSEFALARQNRDGQEALAVARAGLYRFLGESVGQVGDTVMYAIGNGIATVTAKRVLRQDSSNYLYYVRSVGEVADVRTPLLPAKRTVGTYVWHRIAPVRQKGALWVSGGQLRVENSADIYGADADPTGACRDAGAQAGVVRGGTVSISGGGSVTGSPAVTPVSGGGLGFSAFYDSVGVRWDVLTNSSFPVDFDGYFPNFGALPADSFPVIRFSGNKTVSWTSGRGVLIVTGRLTFNPFFEWNGIILAGEVRYDVSPSDAPVINGMLIFGMNGANPNVRFRSGTYRYHSCYAYKANRSLSYLEVVDNIMFEVNG